ncbi:MAG: hypothetical protein ACI9BW_000630 [Gammaproteobacteria bacterium]|jgi:hypothetical protein
MTMHFLFLLAALIAATMPFLDSSSSQVERISDLEFPGWPHEFEGKALTALPLSSREQQFLTDYPERIARFNDGSRELIIRWLKHPTRKLHSASDCFRALDFEINPSAVRTDGEGKLWSSFSAVNDTRKLQVSERIFDLEGNSWIDVSGWYWSATWGRSSGPWWAMTVAEQRRS